MAISPPRVALSVRPLDPARIWAFLRGCTIVMMALCAASAAIDGFDLWTPLDWEDANLPANARLYAYDVVGFANWGVAILLALALLWLTYRLTRNLHAITRNRFALSPTYAVCYYLIPIANLFMPPNVVSQIARATFAAAEEPAPHTPAGWWWAAYLAGSLLGATSTALVNSMDTSYAASLWVDIASRVIGFAACWLTLRVFGPIARAQTRLIAA